MWLIWCSVLATTKEAIASSSAIKLIRTAEPWSNSLTARCSKTASVTRAKSQADVFEEVAVEKGLSSDYVKKVYSKENPALSGLSIEEHRRALERLRTGAAVTELGAAIDTTKKSGE